MFIKDICLWFSFCVVSRSGFCTRVTLSSQNKFRSHPSSSFQGEYFESNWYYLFLKCLVIQQGNHDSSVFLRREAFYDRFNCITHYWSIQVFYFYFLSFYLGNSLMCLEIYSLLNLTVLHIFALSIAMSPFLSTILFSSLYLQSS